MGAMSKRVFLFVAAALILPGAEGAQAKSRRCRVCRRRRFYEPPPEESYDGPPAPPPPQAGRALHVNPPGGFR